ncbi:UDP-glycosyltransferase 71K1-like [Malania oleifera]|uniref:UDP-glycosyltransferase 71K1-like n=1 Tax=Malania oleifera TaxID=397392 RepID=UPI0025ADE0D5|nr:UDP-glycosyltransferase 71K1-like [Malania oleifera]
MQNKTELVFFPTPGIGHLVSVVEFAKRLILRDHRLSVTVLAMTAPFGSPLIHAYAESLSESRIQLIRLPPVDLPSTDPSISPELFIYQFIEKHVPLVRSTLAGLLSSRSNADPPVRLAGLVLDFFCTRMIDVGHELGLPSYLFVTSGAAFLGLMLHLPTRHAQVGAEFSDSDPEWTLPCFANPLPPRLLPSALFCKDGGYDTYMKVAHRFGDAKGIIVNTFYELEPRALSSFSGGQSPPVYAVGPVIDVKGLAHRSNSNDAQRSTVFNWLDEQPPASVVFLCFGSMGSFGEPQIREIAAGLERSGCRFLWSLRRRPEKGRFTAPNEWETPEEALPAGFRERTEGRGRVCGWVPQVEVLAHRAVGGFVSHCGWNSLLESLWEGVPAATWPMYAEQRLNAFNLVRELGGLAAELRMEYGGVGDVVTAEEVERGVRGLMDGNSEVRKKVREMGEKSRKALMDGGSSFLAVGRLIEDVIGHHS